MNEITKSNFEVFSKIDTSNHEQIIYCNDPDSGLKAIIAIHNTQLGPALGGVRMWSYAKESDALNDVLRLSEGMTYKAAISGLNLGGGKAVIIGDSNTQKSELLMRRFGRFVNNLAGKFITAEDVGMNPHDMELIRMETPYVVGVPEYLGGSGDPSPLTAYGVYVGMKAAIKFATGNDSLDSKKIVIQGLGHVGIELLKILSTEGMNISVSDINQATLYKISKDYPEVKIINPENIFDDEIDIFAPCALGAILNDVSIEKMKCHVIAGSANNQLENELIHGSKLMEKGILYAPDYLINAGGLINVYSELNGYNRSHVNSMIDRIYDVTLDIFKKANTEEMPTNIIAKRMATDRMVSIGNLKNNR